VNFDQPDVYHLYYGDESGAPGSILTFFEFPGALPGRAGAGMVHTIQWRVAHEEAIDFWADRLAQEEVEYERDEERRLRFGDPEGLVHELLAVEVPDTPLVAQSPDVPPEHAVHGFHGVRAFAHEPAHSAPLLEQLGFERDGEGDGEWRLAGRHRQAQLIYEPPPEARGFTSAGTVHHIAWAARDDDELDAFRTRVTHAGARATPIIDRQYFHSVYFREPSGILFELASRDIGFTYDEPLDSLGESLMLPPQHEPLRPALERRLTPISNPRQRVAR
jgi:glyoxalase family protein